MEKLLLVGAGGLGRVVLEMVSNIYACAFLDDKSETFVDGTPIIGRINEMENLFPEYTHLLVTIGDNVLRERLQKKAEAIGYAIPTIIHSSAYISPHSHIGSGCIILNNSVVQNNTICGHGCILNSGVELHHDSTLGDFCLIYTNSVVRSLATVGKRVWIGSTATVSTRATVPDDTIIEDGAVFKAQ